MTDTIETQSTEQKKLALAAAAGDIVRATSSIDMALVMIVADIILKPFGQQDLKLASHIVFSHVTIERRIDIARKIITHKLGRWLSRPTHEYEHKAAGFILKAFNKICQNATEDVWIRNVAAHGDYVNSDPPTIIPSPFDLDGVARFHQKRGAKGPVPFFPENGLVVEDLDAATKKIRATTALFMKVADVLRLAILGVKGQGLEDKLVALGKDLKLTPPLLVKPPRGKKRRGGRV